MSFLVEIIARPKLLPAQVSDLCAVRVSGAAVTKTTTKMTKTAEAAAER